MTLHPSQANIIKQPVIFINRWATTFNGQGNGEDVAWDMVVDNSGNVYVTGQSLRVGTGLDYATIKYNAAGVQLWAS